jgi:hypothetical protein
MVEHDGDQEKIGEEGRKGLVAVAGVSEERGGRGRRNQNNSRQQHAK